MKQEKERRDGRGEGRKRMGEREGRREV